MLRLHESRLVRERGSRTPGDIRDRDVSAACRTCGFKHMSSGRQLPAQGGLGDQSVHAEPLSCRVQKACDRSGVKAAGVMKRPRAQGGLLFQLSLEPCRSAAPVRLALCQFCRRGSFLSEGGRKLAVVCSPGSGTMSALRPREAVEQRLRKLANAYPLACGSVPRSWTRSCRAP